MSALHDISMRRAAKMLIKHKAKPSALLASRPHAKCFISHKAQCFYICLSIVVSTLRDIKYEAHGQDASPSALLALRPHAECFI